ncbi:MAG: reverse transcriptase/maturase family protein [Candidatus Omnitrophota bacterium]
MSDLFEQIIAKENLYLAAHRAALGKRFRNNIAFWRLGMEEKIGRLHEDLKSGRYKPGKYRVFQIRDPKLRDISVAPFRDRVVHHAFHDVIESFMDRKFSFDSYACRPGKGTHAALDRAHSFLRANKYCFHGDIRKYFPSINHEVLKGLLRRHIADARVLVVLDSIIDSTHSISSRISPVSGQTRAVLFGKGSSVGLPIGNLTSQFFANLYLHELDHYVKHVLRCRYYIRYMDDILLFENDQTRLKEIRSLIAVFLDERLRLELHPGKSQIYRTAQGIKFLGFRLYVDRRRLATDGVVRFRRRLKKFRGLIEQGLMVESKAIESVICWRAHSANANTVSLRKKLAEEVAAWNLALSAALL